MSSKRRKSPNAIKHGVYSHITILPGENPKEFLGLYLSLLKEWAPRGATEEEAVLSIAIAMWRKRRIQRFIQISVHKNMCDPTHPSYNALMALKTFAELLKSHPGAAVKTFELYARGLLRKEVINQLLAKFPRSNYSSEADWGHAIIQELEENVEEHSAMIPDEALLSRSYATVSGDLFKEELALEERSDAMIDRLIKRLTQVKALKEISGLTEAGQKGQTPEKHEQTTKVVPLKRPHGRNK
jgi:hypothetical protein